MSPFWISFEAKDNGGSGHNWNYKMCKSPVESSPPANQPQLFTGWVPFLASNQQCQITEGKRPVKSISHNL